MFVVDVCTFEILSPKQYIDSVSFIVIAVCLHTVVLYIYVILK